jgi:hypothetical protein
MPRYGHNTRKPGVRAYEIGTDSIDVEFSSGWVYHFTHHKPGPLRVERMKQLAASGRGLSTFISKHVKNRFESRRLKEPN